MHSIILEIMEIIKQVDTARCQAKSDKCQHCAFKREHIEQALGKYDSDKNHHIFRPLTRSYSTQQCIEFFPYAWSIRCHDRQLWEMQCLPLGLCDLLIPRCTSFIQEQRTSFTIKLTRDVYLSINLDTVLIHSIQVNF